MKVFPNEYKRALAEMHEREVEAASTGNNAHVAMKHEPVAAAAMETEERSAKGKNTHGKRSPASWSSTRVEEGYRSPIPSA